MARIYPNPISPDVKSQAERDLYQLFEDHLDDSYVVLHNVPWLDKKENQNAQEGETDFILAHPEYGVLFLEVKGGEISLDQKSQTWITKSRTGRISEIKDPFAQARSSMHAIYTKLRDHNAPTRNYYWPISYAVAFPEISVPRGLRPDAPKDIIIDQADLIDIQTKVSNIYHYWQESQSNPSVPGRVGIEALVDFIAPRWQLKSRLSVSFKREREQINQLTQSQFNAFQMLSTFRRLAIVGGAGTGKTMLALEKTRQLSQEGLQVLFLCYNVNLASWLNQITNHQDNVLITNFHDFCVKAADWANLPLPIGRRDQNYFDEKLPNLLLEAVDSMKHRFDAIVVDEGQDFKSDEWWLALDALLSDPQKGIFYVFLDDNQRIYSQLNNIPISNPPITLNENCRNTKRIHNAILPYSHATYPTKCHADSPIGREPVLIPCQANQQRDQLRKLLVKLVDEEKIEPIDIVILTPNSFDNSSWAEGDVIAKFTLTWNLETKLPLAVRVSTIHSFKGLESPVIILTDLDSAWSDEMIYVGLSRACNQAYILGELPNPKHKRRDKLNHE
jgi:hypothetical protein